MASRIIEEKHTMKTDHAGIQILTSSLRKQFWTVRCRKIIRKILKSCIKWKRFSSKAVEVVSAPLLQDTVKDGVFEIIGVDRNGLQFFKDE